MPQALIDCEICEGEGTMAVDGYVYPGEAPTAAIYSDTCICILEQVIAEQ
jgi:hypothetical protein